MKRFLVWLLLLCLMLTGCHAPQQPTTQTVPSGQSMTVHFIDVGQADCALLEAGGKFVLIDGGNVADSSLVVSYLQKAGVEELCAVICSHAHEDHVGGLPGVLAVYPTEQVYAPTNTYSSKVFDDFLYYTGQQGLQVTIPSPGYTLEVGEMDLTFLGPTQSYADPNDTSLVVLVEFGNTRFLFTGDMETGAENDMLDYWGEDFNWHADVLKVGHHGSDTSTSYRFLREVMPQYAIISVGADNSYGHPHELPLSRLEQAGVTLYRTDHLGTIRVRSDGSSLLFQWEHSAAAPDDPSEDEAPYLIGNKNSKTFHLPTCSSLPKEENRVMLEDYDTAIAEGYAPCSRCLG